MQAENAIVHCLFSFLSLSGIIYLIPGRETSHPGLLNAMSNVEAQRRYDEGIQYEYAHRQDIY